MTAIRRVDFICREKSREHALKAISYRNEIKTGNFLIKAHYPSLYFFDS